MKQQRGLRICGELAAFRAGDMTVEDETVGIVALHQHHPHVRQAVHVHGCERHGVGVAGFAFDRLGKPLREQRERLLGGGEITVC